MRIPLPGHRRTLAWGPTTVTVAADDALLLAWLTEFLAPWFVEVPSTADVSATIAVEPGPQAFTAWRRQDRPRGEAVACFTMDGGEEAWTRACGPEGVEGFLDDARRIALTCEPTPGGRLLRVRADADADDRRVRIVLMRLVREVASAAALARGEVPAHAAAVGGKDGATVFLGPRRAGKSTLLLHALHGQGAALIGNDRAFVRVDDGVPRVRGMPTIVSLREGTVARWPVLAQELARGCWRFHLTVAQAQSFRARGQRPGPASRRAVPGITAAQLGALCGVALRAEAPCTRIVLPRIDPALHTTDGFVLTDLPPAVAAQRILAEGRTAGGARASALVLGAPPPDLERQVAAVHAWTAAVTCQALDLGPAAYDGDALLHALGLAPREATRP